MKSLIFILMLTMVPVKAHAFGWFLLGMAIASDSGGDNAEKQDCNDKGVFIEVYNHKCDGEPFMVKVSKINKIAPLRKIAIKNAEFFTRDPEYRYVNFTAIATSENYYPYCVKESYDEAKKSLLKMNGAR